jgi:uncharacterized protein YijF (DUF1287 family)
MLRTVDRRLVFLGLGGALLSLRAVAQPATQSASDEQGFAAKVAIGGEMRAQKPEVYDPAYVKLAYPMGDVADDRGVCTDTVIRAFRHAGVDLQVEVHEDMRAHFDAYPKLWGLTKADRNIDHRRVPNLETLFRRKGGARTISQTAADYRAGDIVSWRLTGSGLPHIGVVTRKTQAGQPLIAHNIGAGTQEEPCLFSWPIKGWFRFERWT